MAGPVPPAPNATSGNGTIDPGLPQDTDALDAATADSERAATLNAAQEERERITQIARDAALARAVDAECEAILAQQERDTVDARVRAARQRAAAAPLPRTTTPSPAAPRTMARPRAVPPHHLWMPSFFNTRPPPC
jgi:hypothetical protein